MEIKPRFTAAYTFRARSLLSGSPIEKKCYVVFDGAWIAEIYSRTELSPPRQTWIIHSFDPDVLPPPGEFESLDLCQEYIKTHVVKKEESHELPEVPDATDGS